MTGPPLAGAPQDGRGAHDRRAGRGNAVVRGTRPLFPGGGRSVPGPPWCAGVPAYHGGRGVRTGAHTPCDYPSVRVACQTWPQPGASSAARRIARTRLASRAMPRPAMSKAVPWSTETRTTGRPAVMLTPSSP